MGNKKEWTDEEVQAAISEAVKIVAEDRERAEYARLHGLYGQITEETETNDDGKTPPPEKKEKEEPKTGKKSLWWGQQDDE